MRLNQAALCNISAPALRLQARFRRRPALLALPAHEESKSSTRIVVVDDEAEGLAFTTLLLTGKEIPNCSLGNVITSELRIMHNKIFRDAGILIEIINKEPTTNLGQAIKLLSSITANPPDLVITDMEFQSPVDHIAGFRILEHAKKRFPNVPIVLYSSSYARLKVRYNEGNQLLYADEGLFDQIEKAPFNARFNRAQAEAMANYVLELSKTLQYH